MSESSHTIAVESERRRIVNRLKRLEGQVRGLQTMIESRKDCEAVLTQILAAKSALTQVGMHIIGYSMKTCLAEGTHENRDDLIREAFEVFIRYRNLSTSTPDPSNIAPGDSDEMLVHLKGLEKELRAIQELIEEGTQCEEILKELSSATATLGDVGLAVLGHSMQGCLIEDCSQSRDDLIDEAIGVFLKYSNCVK